MDSKKTSQMPWKQLSESVFAKHLSRIESKDFQFDIMKLSPNTTFATHAHTDTEWIYILGGSFSDENGEHNVGDFLHFPEGSIHTVTTGENGLEVIRCWCGRVDPA